MILLDMAWCTSRYSDNHQVQAKSLYCCCTSYLVLWPATTTPKMTFYCACYIRFRSFTSMLICCSYFPCVTRTKQLALSSCYYTLVILPIRQGFRALAIKLLPHFTPLLSIEQNCFAMLYLGIYILRKRKKMLI